MQITVLIDLSEGYHWRSGAVTCGQLATYPSTKISASFYGGVNGRLNSHLGAIFTTSWNNS